MEKKYQVFISSTYIDLIEERQACVEAILKKGHIPAGMELFKSGESQWKTITKWIDNSDIYILILGGRYGSIDKITGKSYTHLEYEYATDKNMPVFAIEINEEMTKKKIRDFENHENVIEVYNKKQYDEFKKMVRDKIISPAGSLAEIKLAVHENIQDFEDEYELKGWIRGGEESSEDLLKQINNLRLKNDENEQLIERLKENKKIEDLSEKYASGLDEFEIKGKFYTSSRYANSNPIKYNWDKIFSLWSVYLFEANNYKKAKSNLEKAIKEKEKLYGVYLTDNCFQRIKIQFLALNYINVFKSKTTQGGVIEFIEITEKGKEKLIELLAVKNK